MITRQAFLTTPLLGSSSRMGKKICEGEICLTVSKGWVVCGTVCGDMRLKDLLRSIISVGYCIPVLDFYLVLHFAAGKAL